MLRVSVLLPVLLILFFGCQSVGPEPQRAVGVATAADTTGLEPVQARHAMVVSGHPEASRIGLEIMRNGGNAVDAAVATAFAIAVNLPYAGNLGGGGFMVIHFPDGRSTTIDFREVAPLAATRDMFVEEDGTPRPNLSRVGHLSVGVPASPAGLLMALERYGSLDRAAVIDPSIRMAEEGFRLTRRQAGRLNRYRSDFQQFESSTRYFVKADGSEWAPEERLVQRDLAEVLRRIRDQGRDGFYRGRTADLIVEEMRRGQGIITHEDLEAYEPVERPALVAPYRDYTIVTMPPPSGGGITLVQLLNAIEPIDPAPYGFQAPELIHLHAEAMRRAFADRAAWAGDPDFVHVPVEGLIAPDYKQERMRDFDPRRVTPSTEIRPGIPAGANGEQREPSLMREGTETTHLSVVDAEGMAVSLTTTVNSWYGSKVVVDGAGFFLNNIMDDFNIAPGQPDVWGGVTGERNVIEPGKRMLSSMTPTIVLDGEQRPVLVAGTRGGTTIPTQIFQIITGVLDHGLPLNLVVEAPRYHHQWEPDVLNYERGLDPEVVRDLEARGWRTSPRGGVSGTVGAIHITYDGGRRLVTGAFDPRADMTPAGF